MADWSRDLLTHSGFKFHVRPARPEDVAALGAFFARVTPEDLRFRFLSSMKAVSCRRRRTTNGPHGSTQEVRDSCCCRGLRHRAPAIMLFVRHFLSVTCQVTYEWSHKLIWDHGTGVVMQYLVGLAIRGEPIQGNLGGNAQGFCNWSQRCEFTCKHVSDR